MNKKSLNKSMLIYVLMVLAIAQINDILAYADDYESEAYFNKITNIREIQGTKNFTIVLTFESEDPIITYAPVSYADSQNDGLNRFFMPNTVLLGDASSPSGSLQQLKSGVELRLSGTLVKKIVDGDKIMITVMKS